MRSMSGMTVGTSIWTLLRQNITMYWQPNKRSICATIFQDRDRHAAV